MAKNKSTKPNSSNSSTIQQLKSTNNNYNIQSINTEKSPKNGSNNSNNISKNSSSSFDREVEVAKIREEVITMLRSAGIVIPEPVSTSDIPVETVTEEIEEIQPEVSQPGVSESQPPVPDATPEGNFLKLTADDVKDEIEYWSYAIYGYVMGANPPWRALEGYLRREWKDYEISKVAFLPNGLFVVRFATMEHRKLVLEKGMFLFDGKPVIIRPWEPQTKITKVSVKTVPIWVKLMGLDLKFWGDKCLEKLSSLIGNFVHVDDLTMDRTLLGFARIMVEVEVDQQFPDKITFVDEMGQNVTRGVVVTHPGLSGVFNRVQGTGNGAMITPTTTPVNSSQGAVLTPARILTRITRHESRLPGVKDGAFVINFNKEMANTSQLSDIKWCLHIANVDLFGLLDTRVRPGSLNKVVASFCGGWSYCTNHQCHDGGRIWILWKEDRFNVTMVEMTAQFIHLKVKDILTSKQFLVTYVYGFNKIEDRAPLWNDLIRLTATDPWIILGDFNNVLKADEKIGLLVKDAETVPFQYDIDNCGLQDLKSIGSFFTWNNKQPSSTRVFSRIDRVLVNDEWVTNWPDHYAYFAPEGDYDHCPCFIQCNDVQLKKKRPFKFYNMWTGVPDFKNIVKEGWNHHIHGSLMYRVVRKLKLMKSPLKALNHHILVLSDVEQSQSCIPETKSKVQRQLQNKVVQIHDIHGQIVQAPEGILQAFENYYKDLLGTQGNTAAFYQNIVRMGRSVHADDWSAINRIPTKEEIKSIIFGIPDDKSSGPDGYSSCFFKAGWDVMGNDIGEAIINFFHEGKLLKQLNSTNLILCVRLGHILPLLINPAQAAFVKGRSIIGNILISQDLIRLYKRTSVSPRCMLKVDLRKAYDSIEWTFVLQMLRALNFPPHFINLVMQCILPPILLLLMVILMVSSKVDEG
ncbi:uncharacterized protein LOC141631877 [Silene latifolia]|uniref:uncharacterized protein LOC141631877 n=1 Tax=Silene latifolia TaxID=37657 RepID=UPI003D7815B4